MEAQLLSIQSINSNDIIELDRFNNHRLRRGIAVLAVVCPVMIILLGLALGPLHGSLSEYYYATYRCKMPVRGEFIDCHLIGNFLRDFFVGGLCVMGVLLALYQGFSRREDWALNLAGVSVACMALSPMQISAEGLPISGWPTSLHGSIHLIGLTCFVLLVAYVAVVCSETTLPVLEDSVMQQRYRRKYLLIGVEMACMPVLVIALNLFSDLSSHYLILALEVICIWTFAGFWLLKSSELAAIEAQLTDSTAKPSRLSMDFHKITG